MIEIFAPLQISETWGVITPVAILALGWLYMGYIIFVKKDCKLDKQYTNTEYDRSSK